VNHGDQPPPTDTSTKRSTLLCKTYNQTLFLQLTEHIQATYAISPWAIVVAYTTHFGSLHILQLRVELVTCCTSLFLEYNIQVVLSI